MILKDKDFLIIRNGQNSFISINGEIAKYEGEEIRYKKIIKIDFNNKNNKKSYEFLEIGKHKIFYNCTNGHFNVMRG